MKYDCQYMTPASPPAALSRAFDRATVPLVPLKQSHRRPYSRVLVVRQTRSVLAVTAHSCRALVCAQAWSSGCPPAATWPQPSDPASGIAGRAIRGHLIHRCTPLAILTVKKRFEPGCWARAPRWLSLAWVAQPCDYAYHAGH
ncbi:hypothetical protein HaLaN_06608 [Haematococcus lacustris]|uniref:Uncharacterized protein n=1 Tax=Haematococcus lacustris TaxID=44745 RepID=A0A699YTX9_HAELA|nr:hypothetical protein HaLaN_06608 [Haematococcus lacustris]